MTALAHCLFAAVLGLVGAALATPPSLVGAALAAAPPGLPPAPQGRPARDGATPAQAGTAVLKGRVLTADGRPLRRVQIRVGAPELREQRTTSTNSQGHFEIRDLPAGRYTVHASRSGFLSVQYGQRRPGEPGRPVQIDEGETDDTVNFTMPRASVISGVIRDETGDPVSGVTVFTMQWQYFEGGRKLVPIGGVGTTRTDDTGQYRALGLAPGDYIVMATLRESWITSDKPRVTMGYAPSYYPGTANRPEAQPVKVGLGQEVSAVDFNLVPGRTATVSGTARRADGSPAAGAGVSVSQEITGPVSSMFSTAGSTRSGDGGAWTLRDVSPGEYRLSLTADAAAGVGDASMMLTVAGVDVEGLVLSAPAPVTVSGVVVTDDGQPMPDATRRVTAEPVEGRRRGVLASDDNGRVGPDGRFTVRNVSGRVLLGIYLPPGWAIRSIDVDGREHAEVPLDLKAGAPIDGVRMVLTRRFPAITGRIVDEKDEPADGTLLFFPADPRKRFERGGTNRLARPDQAGNFRVDAVRPGEYLAVALDYVQEWQAQDSEFLASLRDRATKVSVVEGENQPLTLRVVR